MSLNSKSFDPKLRKGSRVAVIGGGPAGSFFCYFALDMAERVNLEIEVDIYEPRDFNALGPAGCNMCGGIISESLVQNLALDGIDLPSTVIQRGIESYTLHMDVGDVVIKTPRNEKRIFAVYRGRGPRGTEGNKWESFDAHLQKLAVEKGARVIHERVDRVIRVEGRPQVTTQNGVTRAYDLLVIATGVNSGALRPVERLNYRPPATTKTFIREYHLGEATIGKYLGNSMHVFLLDLPHIEFAALVPKGAFVTACLLGEEIDGSLVQSFFGSPEVKRTMPPDWQSKQVACQCSPHINIAGVAQPFSDGVIYIGDCAVTRLYKDGIGAAYRLAKLAATIAVFKGIGEKDFRRHYAPECRSIVFDNAIGKLIFWIARTQQHHRHDRRGIMAMVADEQRYSKRTKRMSMVMWDMFTGSASYREIFLRTLHPAFILRLLWSIFSSNAHIAMASHFEESTVSKSVD